MAGGSMTDSKSDPSDHIPMKRRSKRRRSPPEDVPVFWRCACGRNTPQHITFCGACGAPRPQPQSGTPLWWDEDDRIYHNITRR